MPHVQLRDIHDEDLDQIFAFQHDAEAARVAAVPSRDRAEFDDHWERKVLGDPHVTVQAITHDGRLVGSINAFDRDDLREVGYWIGREHWGKGIATAAVSQFVVLERRRPLHGIVAKQNPASARVLEKCGFELTGERVDPADGIEELVYVLS